MAIAANAIKRTPKARVRSKARTRDNLYGYLFLTPWLIGFLGLFVGPGLASLYLSLTKYDVISAPEFIGVKNYVDMFTKDDLFWSSLGRTFYFAVSVCPWAYWAQCIWRSCSTINSRASQSFARSFLCHHSCHWSPPSFYGSGCSTVILAWSINGCAIWA